MGIATGLVGLAAALVIGAACAYLGLGLVATVILALLAGMVATATTMALAVFCVVRTTNRDKARSHQRQDTQRTKG